jgi:arylsulfatase A-like enzyme
MSGAAALPLTIGEAIGEPSRARPNVLFVFPDQWRFSALSHVEFGDALIQTPNLDRFAAEGTRWRRAYATDPYCTPSRAAIMTGRYPHQTGMLQAGLMMPPNNRCLGEMFREAGYATHYIGKTHYDGPSPIPGQTHWIPKGWRRRGFTTYEGFEAAHNYFNSATFDNDGNPIGIPGVYEPEFQTDLAINFMTANRHRPWFVFLSWGPPHTPYQAVPPTFKRFTITEADRRPNVPPGNPDAGDIENYFAQCEALDYQFGRLMDSLRKLGLERNTLVVFTSDHGDFLRSHNRISKFKPQEESMHVPLLMRWPERILPGQSADTVIGGVDMMPTLLSMCGLPVPRTCFGQDKSWAVLGGSPTSDDSIYCQGHTGSKTLAWRAIVTERYKLVVDNSDPLDINSVSMLYDLQLDPYELTNQATDAGFAGIRQQLFDRLVQWRDETEDTFPDIPPKAEPMYT